LHKGKHLSPIYLSESLDPFAYPNEGEFIIYHLLPKTNFKNGVINIHNKALATEEFILFETVLWKLEILIEKVIFNKGYPVLSI
jgi:hypothetical protein